MREFLGKSQHAFITRGQYQTDHGATSWMVDLHPNEGIKHQQPTDLIPYESACMELTKHLAVSRLSNHFYLQTFYKNWLSRWLQGAWGYRWCSP